MAIQFSILIMLHSALVLITTAEDYKCLPLILRKTCCWINETYLARNVIIFASILINFLGAILNIVSTPPHQPSAIWGTLRSSEFMEPAASCIAFPWYQLPSCAWSSSELRDRAQRCGYCQNCAFHWWQVVFLLVGEVICSKGAPISLTFLYYQWPIDHRNK